MILEHTLIRVKEGHQEAFEQAIRGAVTIVKGAPGFGSLYLERGIEHPHEYLLLITWDSVEAHVDGFRQSPAFGRWRQAIQEHFAEMPDMSHFTSVPDV